MNIEHVSGQLLSGGVGVGLVLLATQSSSCRPQNCCQVRQTCIPVHSLQEQPPPNSSTHNNGSNESPTSPALRTINPFAYAFVSRYSPTCAMIAMLRMFSGSAAIAAPSSFEDVDSTRRAGALLRAAAPSGPCMASLLLHLMEAEERRTRRKAPESIIVLAALRSCCCCVTAPADAAECWGPILKECYRMGTFWSCVAPEL